MKSNPLVSIIMNCYNSDTYLKQAIESVIEQTYENWEIIFWDNQSTDNSASIVNSYDDKRVKYFYAPTHTTLGEARNGALKKVKGKFISFLDCDDWWDKDKIEVTLAPFSDEKVGLVHTNGQYFYEDKQKYKTFHKLYQPSGYILEKLVANYTIKLVSAMFRTKVIYNPDIVFDTRFNMIEEFDFFVRISENWKVRYIYDKTCFWRAHSSSLTWSKMDKVGEEYEYFLKSISDDIPTLNGKKCLKKIEAKIAYHRYINILEKEDIAKREIIKPFISSEIKLIIPYIFSYIGKEKYQSLLKLVRKKV